MNRPSQLNTNAERDIAAAVKALKDTVSRHLGGTTAIDITVMDLDNAGLVAATTLISGSYILPVSPTAPWRATVPGVILGAGMKLHADQQWVVERSRELSRLDAQIIGD